MSGRGAPPLFVGIHSETAEVAGRTRLVRVTAASVLGLELALHRAEGLSSVEVLEWLGEVRERFEGKRLVQYGSRFAVSQWLAGLPRGCLRALWDGGSVRWHRSNAAEGADRYSLRLIDGHNFGVWREPWRSRVSVSDVLPLFSCPLEDACEEWGVESLEPARMIAELMGRVALKGRELGLSPSVWGAPGALAGVLLRRHAARDALPLEDAERPEGLSEAVLTAYYGGRVDMLAQGRCDDVLALDMRSAYPWALAQAPTMRGEWRHYAENEHIPFPDPHAMAIVKVRFSSPPLRALTPLPVRTPDRVTYPASGEGWYHLCELDAAMRAGCEIERAYEAWVFEPADDSRPWGWLADVYAQRAELRLAGDEGERLVKLALNAVYGKLAQTRGDAKYQCFELAGWVTAMVRAAMLDAANIAPAAVISIHTDGLLFDAAREPAGEPRLTIGEGLGEWERHTARNLLIVQPGVYTYDEPDGTHAESRRIVGRTRGIPAAGLSWERVAAEWELAGTAGRVTIEQSMHHGIGTCFGRRRWATLGQYVSEPRTVSFSATSRFPSQNWSGGLQAMMPVAWAGPATPYEPNPEPDPDELLRREQPT